MLKIGNESLLKLVTKMFESSLYAQKARGGVCGRLLLFMLLLQDVQGYPQPDSVVMAV